MSSAKEMNQHRKTLTEEAHTSVVHDLLLVLATDVLVINRLACFGVNPANVEPAILETSVEVFDVTHHPRHFDAPFERQTTLSLHLPPCARRSPWSNFSEARDNNDLIKVDDIA